MQRLREETAKLPDSNMQIAPRTGAVHGAAAETDGGSHWDRSGRLYGL